MGKYLKLFETHAEYESFIQTDYDKPNVSYCEDNNEMHYNTFVPPLPNNIIRYEASAKLTETTSDKSSGLHTNAFNTTIVSHTFENGVGTIEFEDDVTTIQGFAFLGAPINKLIIPNTVTILGYKYSGGMNAGAFTNCNNLEEIVLSNNLIEIGDYAFNNCSSLASVTIPNSVTSIGAAAFSGCDKLTSVTIPSGVTSIGNNAFYSCDSLTSVTIPSGVTSIGNSAFYVCSGLTSVTIPDSVTSIGNSAFTLCYGLTSVIIGNGVTSIGDRAFYSCDSLTSVTIPSGVTSIGNDAFTSCDSLTNVTIGNSVTSIGDSAFNNCDGLTSVTIPNSVTSIGESAFRDCGGLVSVTVKATTPPTLGSFAFGSNASGRKIYVSSESVEAYKAATNWSVYAPDIEAIPTT